MMVPLMKSGGKVSPESQLQQQQQQRGKTVSVKSEAEDPLEDRYGPLNKRSKLSSPLPEQHSLGTGAYPVPPSEYNPLDEPSPLGLRLKKSTSFLDLIQTRLSQGNASKVVSSSRNEQKGTSTSSAMDKLKASNFPASVLKIGTWEYKSRYEGDLVAKCYFAKHKLVWEVLDGGLKNKIEIQWSDIVALKAVYPDDGPGTLDVVLGRQPLFFRETNPQPRKHTLWQATSDFTGGQATIHKRHFLQCPQGLLGKHFEKLVQCDPRLNYLSQQAEISLESPHFETKVPVFDDSHESGHDLNNEDGHVIFDLQDAASPSGAQSSSSKNENHEFVGRHHRETPSPSSVMDTSVIEELRIRGVEEPKGLSSWDDHIKACGLQPSMSVSDLVSLLENRISENGNNSLSSDDRKGLEILEDISRCLFTDSQQVSASEKSIMSRVDSLCCLLQKDPVTFQDYPVNVDNGDDVTMMDKKVGEPYHDFASVGGNKFAEDSTAPDGESNDVSERKQAAGMSRNDSVGELLLNLPRIASLPQFFFNLSDDFENRAR